MAAVEDEDIEILREEALASIDHRRRDPNHQGRQQQLQQQRQQQQPRRQQQLQQQRQQQQPRQQRQQQRPRQPQQQQQLRERARGFLRLEQNNMRDLRELVERRKLNRLLANDFERRRRFLANCGIPGRKLHGMNWWQDMGNGRFRLVDRV